jgi:hypothetical protein
MAAAVGCVTIARTVSSEHQACEILQHAAVEYRLTRTDLTGRYYCDPLPSRAAYYVLGLRYRTTPDELVGSNLIGWYAVAKRDGAVFAWDINYELPPAPLVPGPPFETH